MGTADTMTLQAQKAVNSAEVVIGAERMTDIAKDKTVFNAYKADEIAEIIAESQCSVIAVLLSGDISFYSGAKKLLEVLKGYDVELVAGISSLSYFCAKLNVDYENVKLLSLHGKQANAIMHISTNHRVFMLLTNGNDIKQLCQKLNYYNMSDVILHIGQRLSYDDESIISIKASDLEDFDFKSPVVVMAENNSFKPFGSYISDDEFIRGNVPMTKSEIRTLSVSKLNVDKDSIIYDIGAGTGSVSVELSQRAIDGKVYAVEKNSRAIELLEANKQKFACDNITIVEGSAPLAMADLPKPTHIFVGGSSGNMEDIINVALAKNPEVVMVINTVTLNTLSQIMDIVSKYNFDADITSVSVSKNRELKGYHIMEALNTVYIIKLCKKGEKI